MRETLGRLEARDPAHGKDSTPPKYIISIDTIDSFFPVEAKESFIPMDATDSFLPIEDAESFRLIDALDSLLPLKAKESIFPKESVLTKLAPLPNSDGG